MNGTVIIDSTVGKDTFFLITWNQQLPSIYLFDPSGISMGTFIVDSASKTAYLNIPGTTKVSNSFLDLPNFTGENTSFDIINMDANTCIISKLR